jgi:UDP-glucose 4-epimerase
MFVTGAAGFIGSTLVDRLLAEGHRVVGIDNLSTGAAANLDSARRYTAASPDRLTFVRVDTQAPELGDIVAGTNPDVIFHLAAHPDLPVSASDPQFDARGNVLGTINLCEAARRAGVARIVYAGSGESRDGAPARLPTGDSSRFDPPTPHVRPSANLSGVDQRLRAAPDPARRSRRHRATGQRNACRPSGRGAGRCDERPRLRIRR